MMKSITRLAYIFSIILASNVCLAQTSNVDWKFYGGANIGDGQEECFYDSKGISQQSNGYLRVWTKCLLLKDINGINIEKDYGGAIVRNSGEKVVNHYTPPIATIETIDKDNMVDIIAMEETANIAHINSQAKIFYELNCPERMMRELSIYLHSEGKEGSKEKPSDWKYTPPEGNGDRLLRVLCRAQ